MERGGLGLNDYMVGLYLIRFIIIVVDGRLHGQDRVRGKYGWNLGQDNGKDAVEKYVLELFFQKCGEVVLAMQGVA